MKILLILLLTALPTFARLGETKAECEKRYGKAINTLSIGVVVYQKEGIEIFITYSKDKAVNLMFSKVNPDPSAAGSGRHLPISADECDTLLKANSGGAEWKMNPTSEPDSISWTLGDKKARAVYDPEGSLTIVDMAFMLHPPEEEKSEDEKTKEEAEKKKGEAKKLDGF